MVDLSPIDLEKYIGDNLGTDMDISISPGIQSLTDSLLALSVTEKRPRATGTTP